MKTDMFSIISGKPEHASFLGECVAQAIGVELCEQLAGTVEATSAIFGRLAARTDTQYSYRNALVAIDAQSRPIGACICYDGGKLHELRVPTADLFLKELNFNISEGGDETAAGELYIDTLAVSPAYRRKGVASALLRLAIEKARRSGLPAGLLVEPENNNARALYEKIGFSQVGQRPFAGTIMNHMQTNSLD